MKTYKIVIDTLGSDQGPTAAIKGAALLLARRADTLVTLIGDEALIKGTLEAEGADLNRVKIIHTPDSITNLDNIGEAFFKKPNASVFLGLKELKEDESTIGMLTAGNSGAILMGTMRYIPSGYTRPCLSAVLPNEKNGFTLLVDCGASIDVNSAQLVQFAKLGTTFMKNLYKIESPKVALLSNGVERTKGNKLVKETFPLLEQEEDINFIGNVEGLNALSGECDVLVCDGFAGNQILKVTEGTAKRVITDIVKYIKKNNRPDMMPLVQDLMQTYDMTNLGGAIVLGAKKTVVKCHGCSGPEAFSNVADILINLEDGNTFFEGKDFRG
ncbi:MAG: hypothetical protein HUJ59_02910 [Bacilli bacterium]|nr:hypothetical protein [Bacilli bacterium]